MAQNEVADREERGDQLGPSAPTPYEMGTSAAETRHSIDQKAEHRAFSHLHIAE